MYSTNLHIDGELTLFSGEDCVGAAYGWETIDKDQDGNITHVGPATQTAKDNVLLWSLAPKLFDALDHLLIDTCYECTDGETPCANPYHRKALAVLIKLSSAMHSEVTQ